jgi:hypothetical protein
MPIAERDTELRFPLGGIDRADMFGKQNARPAGADLNGKPLYVATSRFGKNVRAFDPLTQRARGGSRVGLAKFFPLPVVAGWLVQGLGSSTAMETNVSSISGLYTTVVAFSQGIAKYARPGDLTWTTATNNTGNTPPLALTGIIRSASCVQKLWIADGVSRVFFDPVTGSLETWAATAGTMPGSGLNRPRLICTWRGRIVMAAMIGDEINWFMSKVNDPTNWDFAPVSPSSIQAVAGNDSKQGQLGQPIQALIPYSDDVLVIGTSSSLWQMRGDPADNGSLDLITDAVGTAFGTPWCLDPNGRVYFLGSRPTIYRMEPGQKPTPISHPIKRLLDDLDLGANTVNLAWDDVFKCLRVFVTPISAPGPTTNFAFEERTGAWWTDEFGNDDHAPLAICTVDGVTAEERALLIGSWDGYVRTFQPGQTTDDGTPIASEVVLGPILTPLGDDMLFQEIQGILAKDSGAVTYEVRIGATAEAALDSEPVVSGTWGPGRSYTRPINRAAHALYVTLRSTNAWAMESIRAGLEPLGLTRRRNH